MHVRPWFAALLLCLAPLSATPVRAEDEEPAPDPAPAPEGGEAAPEGGGDAAGGDAAGGDAAAASALTKTFPNINLSWTLPKPLPVPPPKEGEEPKEGEGEPAVWQWSTGGNPNIQRQERGQVAGAGLVRSGEVLMEMELYIQPAKPGASIEGFTDNQENVDSISRNFDSAPAPQVDRDVPVGNWKGGALSMTGKGTNGRPLQIRLYFVFLKAVIYEVHVVAHDHAQKAHNKALLAALAGFKFQDTDEGVRGPIAAPVLPHTEIRGKPGTEEKLEPQGVMKLKKPAIFAKVEAAKEGSSVLESWPFAAEARKPGAYAFVGVKRIRMPKSQTEGEAPELESLVDDIESKWKNEVTDAVTRPKSEKSNRSPGSFKSGKGYEYVFRGTAHGVPWVEKGWVVKDAGAIWVIRTQFGGKTAETVLGPDVTALVKSMAFSK